MKIYKFYLKAQFSQKLQMVQRPTIPHFLAKVMDNKIPEGQGRGRVKDLPCPFFLKSTLFTNSAPELSLIVL